MIQLHQGNMSLFPNGVKKPDVSEKDTGNTKAKEEPKTGSVKNIKFIRPSKQNIDS